MLCAQCLLAGSEYLGDGGPLPLAERQEFGAARVIPAGEGLVSIVGYGDGCAVGGAHGRNNAGVQDAGVQHQVVSYGSVHVVVGFQHSESVAPLLGSVQVGGGDVDAAVGQD